jgi:hypothetical protein
MSVFKERSSIVRGVRGCLDAVVTVQVDTSIINIRSVACSSDVSRDRNLLFKKVMDSAKYQAYEKVKGVPLGFTSDQVISQTNVMVLDIKSFIFRYNVSDRRIKTVNRGGRRYNYVFDRNTGKIITYSRFESPRSVESYLERGVDN